MDSVKVCSRGAWVQQCNCSNLYSLFLFRSCTKTTNQSCTGRCGFLHLVLNYTLQPQNKLLFNANIVLSFPPHTHTHHYCLQPMYFIVQEKRVPTPLPLCSNVQHLVALAVVESANKRGDQPNENLDRRDNKREKSDRACTGERNKGGRALKCYIRSQR